MYACNSTKKVPAGQYLLTKNHFEYVDADHYKDEIPSYAAQKPNKRDLMFLPTRLLIYNMGNPKYDSIVSEYMTFPNNLRTQKLRDSLFRKYNKPEFVGKSIFWSRLFHTIGRPPVILDEAKTASSAEKMRQFLVYRGYWDSHVDYSTNKKDSAAKKAQATYKITYKDPTFIKDYTYNIPYDNIRALYEANIKDSYVKSGTILNQVNLEEEVKRITEQMQENGYFSFNRDGGEIYFTADTLTSRKQVPLSMQILKDSINSPYKKYTIGDVEVEYINKITENASLDTLYNGVKIKRIDEEYKVKTLWRPITLKRGEIYFQKNLDLTKRNFMAMNNFSIADYRETIKPNDTVINVKYRLIPLPRYNFKTAFDVHYSQILNFGFSPSVELTARNIFKGAENLTTSLSGTFGTVYTQKNPDAFLNASEFSLQFGLNFPRLLLPFNTEKLVPNRYSPVSNINIGVSAQNNIGMDRRIFNAGFNYFVNIGDRVIHKLSLFNTQLSITRNKSAYYDYFPADDAVRDQVFDQYFIYNPNVGAQYNNGNGTLTKDDVTNIILADGGFTGSFTTEEEFQLFLNYLQVLYKKERITQNVIINSLFYNYTYNEIGKKGYDNPFYFDGKFELAGNLLSLVSKKINTSNGLSANSRQIFGIPISQFVKFDVDIRKYFTFSNKHQFIIRQVAGVGIPYGNSSNMPFVRSYFSGGSNDVRAWIAFGGLGPADTDVDEKVRAYMMGNVKLTTNIEYRFPINKMFEGAVFTDAGNIWSLKDTGIGDEFKFKKFIPQMGLGSGFGLRIHVAYITVRLDLAYKMHDPNQPKGERWVIDKIQPLKPTLNFSIGYPF